MSNPSQPGANDVGPEKGPSRIKGFLPRGKSVSRAFTSKGGAKKDQIDSSAGGVTFIGSGFSHVSSGGRGEVPPPAQQLDDRIPTTRDVRSIFPSDSRTVEPLPRTTEKGNGTSTAEMEKEKIKLLRAGSMKLAPHSSILTASSIGWDSPAGDLAGTSLGANGNLGARPTTMVNSVKISREKLQDIMGQVIYFFLPLFFIKIDLFDFSQQKHKDAKGPGNKMFLSGEELVVVFINVSMFFKTDTNYRKKGSLYVTNYRLLFRNPKMVRLFLSLSLSLFFCTRFLILYIRN